MAILNLLLFAAAFCAVLALYRPVRRALRRFDAANTARRAAEVQARSDGFSHYRQTLQVAEEQVEEVTAITIDDPRTGLPVERFLFEGVRYGNRADAEAARRQAIVGKARAFYRDLDTVWLKGRAPSAGVGRSPSTDR